MRIRPSERPSDGSRRHRESPTFAARGTARMAVQNTIGTDLKVPTGIREQIVFIRRVEQSEQRSNRRKAIVILVPGFPATETETHWVPPVHNFVRAITRRNPDVAVHVV